MSQSSNNPAVGSCPGDYLRLCFKLIEDTLGCETMKIEDTAGKLMYEVRTGAPNETGLYDANNCSIVDFRRMAGSFPIKFAAVSTNDVNPIGQTLLIVSKQGVFSNQLDVVTLNDMEKCLAFLNPPMRAGLAYKIKGSFSERSIVVSDVNTSKVIAQMRPGADADSFFVDFDPEANAGFIASLFGIINAMKRVSTFKEAPLDFCLNLGEEFLAGIANGFGRFVAKAGIEWCTTDGSCF